MGTRPQDQGDLAARAAALKAQLDTPQAESWRPDDHAKGHPRELVGVFVRMEIGHTSYGEARIVVLRDPQDHEWSLWLLHQVLRNEFEKLRPQIGDLVAVKYEGKQTPKGGGNPYDGYRVRVESSEASGTVDWGAPVAARRESESGFGVAPAGHPVEAPSLCPGCGFAPGDGHAGGCPHGDIPY